MGFVSRSVRCKTNNIFMSVYPFHKTHLGLQLLLVQQNSHTYRHLVQLIRGTKAAGASVCLCAAEHLRLSVLGPRKGTKDTTREFF